MIYNKYIDRILSDLDKVYYAHVKEDGSKELLKDHLDLTYLYYTKMCKYKNVEKIIKQIVKDVFKVEGITLNYIYELFESAIYYHDIGKINPLFQKNKMTNDLNIDMADRYDTHSALSARIYIDYFKKEIADKILNDKENTFSKRDMVIIQYILYYFGYIISKHHTNLDTIINFETAIKDLNIPQVANSQDELYEREMSMLNDFVNDINPDKIGLYILCKMLYSLLITADFYATYEYMTGNIAEFDSKKNMDLFKVYNKSDRVKKIRSYKEKNKGTNGINKLRNDLFLEVEDNLLNNLDKDIYYIEAPTGSGKTNIAINVARVLYENNKDIKSVQYVFPFNTLVEQTAGVFNNYFKSYEEYIVINSNTAMAEDINENLDYESVYIKNVFRQYPIVMTSHVNLFDTLFSTSKEANYGLYNLINSIVIIDEIQAYSNNIWRQIIEMFSKYSKLLNIKIVIMSATLPRLDMLLNQTLTNFYPLVIDTKKYYQDKLIKQRVKLDFSLLEEKMDIDKLIDKILEHKSKKVLVECIKKKTADAIYKRLKLLSDNVMLLTGDDNTYTREKIIDAVNNSLDIILVSTQTIEAGVDIDMDIGFKDISFLDSEEQFIGRINRSSKKKNCIAYFFDLDDARSVYKNDNRLEYTLKNKEVRVWLLNKQFDLFYNNLLKKIYSKTDKYDNNNITRFYNECCYLNYKKVQKTMQLIDNNTIQLFLNYTMNIDGQELVGRDIFDEYIKICNDSNLKYSEKKVKLSAIYPIMSLFTYTIYNNNIIKGEKIKGFYYLEDGADYMEDGRFNRDKYSGEGDGLFL